MSAIRQETAGEILGRARRADLEHEQELSRRYGHVTGTLLIAVSLASIASALLVGEQLSPVAYLAPAFGVCLGQACFAIPWNRVSHNWLHLFVVAATAEVALGVVVADVTFGFNYLLVAVLAAYIFQRRQEIAAHVGLISLALLSPLVYEAVARPTLRNALISLPGLIVAAGIVAYLRERLESKERAFHAFTEEALAIVMGMEGGRPFAPSTVTTKPLAEVLVDPRRRLASLPGGPGATVVGSVAGGVAGGAGSAAHVSSARAQLAALVEKATAVRRASRQRNRRHTGVGIAAALALPLVPLGLAVSGVSLPGPVRAPFESIGIHLPWQGSTPEHADRATLAAKRKSSQNAGSASGGHSLSVAPVEVPSEPMPSTSPAPGGSPGYASRFDGQPNTHTPAKPNAPQSPRVHKPSKPLAPHQPPTAHKPQKPKPPQSPSGYEKPYSPSSYETPKPPESQGDDEPQKPPQSEGEHENPPPPQSPGGHERPEPSATQAPDSPKPPKDHKPPKGK